MKLDGISVILPSLCRSFTHEWLNYFKRAAASVLTQKCDLPLELIIIDDGSVSPISKQKAVSDIFNDPRVKYIRFQNNNGLVFALNTGLNSAEYDLIARIDSDDMWRPGKLEKQLTLITADPDLTIVGTGMKLIHEDCKKDEVHIRPGTWKEILQFTAGIGCPFPHGSILALKSVFQLMGGYSHDASVTHCEDFALWSIWLRFFKGAMIEEVLYNYTVSECAVSSKYAEQQKHASGKVHQEYLCLKNYKMIPEMMEKIAELLNVSLLMAGQICFLAWRFYDFILADKEFLEALRLIMPDRQVMQFSEINNQLCDRLFYFSLKECPDNHVRCLHNIEYIIKHII